MQGIKTRLIQVKFKPRKEFPCERQPVHYRQWLCRFFAGPMHNRRKLQRNQSDELESQAPSILLIDFQEEMMGHAGEIYFAVIKPTEPIDS